MRAAITSSSASSLGITACAPFSSTPRTWTPIKDGLLPTPPGSLRDAVVSEIAKAVGRTLLSALFSRPMAPSSSGRALHHLAQGLFAVLVIAIWVFVWMVQLQAIRLPDWTRDWHEAPADVQTTYAVTLFACVGLIFVLFLAAGLFQMRRRPPTVARPADTAHRHALSDKDDRGQMPTGETGKVMAPGRLPLPRRRRERPRQALATTRRVPGIPWGAR
ncbi:hypothetical protein RJ55_06684 [Drechmeria coniospora]|nr:hypothetical protein RJ55_06684 [Drechmeria coniospora]